MSITLTMRETAVSEVEARLRASDSSNQLDEESFRRFYEKTARPVWAYLARLTGDPHAADDLLQEAFYRFVRAAAPHENDDHRKNSLYRIATNLARDHQRRSK